MVYVEVFGGGGSVLLNKERSVREVLNDANGNLINLYRVVREHPDELKDRLLYVMHNREDFKIAQRRLAQFSYKDDILRAADFYQVVRQSYAGNGKQFSAVARSMWAGFPAIDRVAGRLQGVTLEKEDFGVIFQRYDSPTTVFYIDPPYFFTEDYYPGNIFLRSDHQRLAAILLNAEGLWLLSYNLCPEVLELYQQPGIFIEQVDRINNMAQRYEGGAIYQEVLYFKRQIEETQPLYKNSEVYQRERPPQVEDSYMARAEEIRAHAKDALASYKADPYYQYLLHHREELDDAGLKKTSILPVLNYAQALETAIREDDLVTMRRHERADRYLDSFRSCAVKVRDVLENQELNLFALAAQDDFPFPEEEGITQEMQM